MICQSWKLDGDDVWHKKHWWMNMVMPVMMHGKGVEVQFTSLALRFQLRNSRSFALRQVDQLSNKKHATKMICSFVFFCKFQKRHTHKKKNTLNPWILKLPASPEETHFSQYLILGFRACEDVWPGKHLMPGHGKTWRKSLNDNLQETQNWEVVPIETILQWGCSLLILIPLTNSGCSNFKWFGGDGCCYHSPKEAIKQTWTY